MYRAVYERLSYRLLALIQLKRSMSRVLGIIRQTRVLGRLCRSKHRCHREALPEANESPERVAKLNPSSRLLL